MVPERIQSLRIATLLLLLSANLTVEVSISDFRPLGTSLLIAAVWSVLAVVGYFLCPTTKQPQNKPPRWLAVLVLIAMFLPMALEPLFRQWADMGNSLEFQMVYALRNIGLVLAACSAWMVALRTAAVVSIFLILFSISLSEQTATLVSLLGYTVVAICWLLTAYWNVLQPAFRQPSVVLSSERIVRIRRAGYALPLILIFVPTLLFAGYQLMPQEVLQKLGEWLPTSGGTGEFDPYARSGVNDGNEEIAGQNPNSTGMTDSQQFLESPLPSLYDVFNDSYGEPFKPQEHEHSIALDPSLMMKETEKDPADNLRPNRQFSTQRKPSDKKGNPKDRAARAIFEVEGKTHFTCEQSRTADLTESIGRKVLTAISML